MWQELRVVVYKLVPLHSVHILLIESLANLMAYELQEELTFCSTVEMHIGCEIDWVELACLAVHALQLCAHDIDIAVSACSHSSCTRQFLHHLALMLTQVDRPQFCSAS